MRPEDIQPEIHTAADVPDLREHLVRGWREGALRLILGQTTAPMHLPMTGRGAVRREMTKAEWCTLALHHAERAPLYHVTRQMTELVVQAAQAVPYYQVHADQLPSDSGLVVFGDTMCDVPRERLHPGQRVLINAALWFTVADTGDGPGVMVVTLQDTGVLLHTQPMGWTDHERRTVVVDMQTQMGSLSYHDEYPMPFGSTPWTGSRPDLDELPADGPVRVRNQAVAAMICTWTMMGQRITTTQDEKLPRALTRRYAREGRPEPAVRTTTLRRKASAHQDTQERAPGASGRVYTKQWVVSEYAYWRNTWYPSKERHQQQLVLVPSYVKGPEGAPMVGGERVNVLRR